MRAAPLVLLPMLLCAAECPLATECDDYACTNRIEVQLGATLESYELTVRYGDAERTATCPHRDVAPASGVLLECGNKSFSLDFGPGKEMAGVAFDEPLTTMEVAVGGAAHALELGPPDLAESDPCHDCSLRKATLEGLR